MAESKLYIPKKLKIGFQNREDTFNGKLSYIIYYDDKGVLRKEKSWTSWCDASLGNIEVDNVPLNGYMINKGVQRSADWFGTGRSLVRIHHPDGYEFEISIDNFINVLMHSDVSKRDITQQCVLAWSGTNLVLLPTNSLEYQQSLEFTARQTNKISAKDLVKGALYTTKSADSTHHYVYLGHHKVFSWSYNQISLEDGQYTYNNVCKPKSAKHHVFYDLKADRHNPFVTIPVNNLSECVNDQVHPQYAEFYELFTKTDMYSPPAKLVAIETLDKTAIANAIYVSNMFSRYNRETEQYDRGTSKINLSKIVDDIVYTVSVGIRSGEGEELLATGTGVTLSLTKCTFNETGAEWYRRRYDQQYDSWYRGTDKVPEPLKKVHQLIYQKQPMYRQNPPQDKVCFTRTQLIDLLYQEGFVHVYAFETEAGAVLSEKADHLDYSCIFNEE